MHRIAVLATLVLSGCGLVALQQQHEAVANLNAQARANAETAAALTQTDKFVVGDHVWLCLTREAALAGAPCAGGEKVLKNRVVTVTTQAPIDGVWPVLRWGDGRRTRLFVVASAIGDLPDTSALDEYALDVSRRFPNSRRIPLATINFADLILRPGSYKGRYLIVRQPSRDMTNKDFADGTFTFTIPIQVTSSSYATALAQFELKNRTLVDFEDGGRSYQCGPKYCDDFVIVAELTNRTARRVDELGHIHALPVFEIRELGDRYGTYGAP